MTEGKTLQEEQNSPNLRTEEFSLRRSIEFISSLISLSYSIRVFPTKWLSIRTKLEQLNSGLIAAENCSFDDNSVFSDLVQSIQSTATECHDLARCCVDLTYSGKLLMQSDLDVVSSKFDLQLKDLKRIYTTGIITFAYAIVVSRPGIGASYSDLKFYVRDLYTQMKVGDLKMKKGALISLCEVLQDDDRYVKIIAELGELVGLLVGFLEYEEACIQEKSAEAISTIAGFDSCKGELVGAGVIASLICVLEKGSNVGKESAAKALQKLTENLDNVWSVSAHGGVTVLLKICKDGDFSGELIGSACRVLRNLAGVDEIKRFMVEEGVISVFMKLMRSKDKIIQIGSIEFLQTMAYLDEPIQQKFSREGGTQSLIHFLDPASGSSLKTQAIALRAIDTLCLSSMDSLDIFMGTQFLNWVVSLMHNGDAIVQELAVKTAFHLCGISEETKKAMGDAGFIPVFISLLDSRSSEIREIAAAALSNLVSVRRNRKKFIQEDSNIICILQLLDLEKGKSGINKFLLPMLLSLTDSNTGRRKIVNSGSLKHLKKLAEAEVTEAKRIMKRLSENRLLSMLNGIWNS
ncbi:vacuolar protein 8 [Cinnamomum micranthum f. kanehirae]|uniref:Vacuolar protein 8 n=1 Tax=Cinnamomum micranthum f. kanehirae TaxID=337451 RepID=A0A443PJE6_9MAGN|nr:vacuolar protein 8 [Cinnamomum micranthum f. kanehirae]